MHVRLFISTIILCAVAYGVLAYAHVRLLAAARIEPVPLLLQHTPQHKSITITWVGDMVPTSDALYNASVLENVRSLLSTSDYTMGNFEGTLALPDRIGKCDTTVPTCFAFRGDQTFVQALQSAGFDFVSLVNNHSLDFFNDGLTDSETALSQSGLMFISPRHQRTEITIQGMRIGILGVSSSPVGYPLTDYDFIKKTITELKTRNDFVVVIFHGGAEGADKTMVTGKEEYQGNEDRGNVELLAHTAVDAGANVVFGSGPHVLRKIEYYNSGLIAYSLGNFVGGNGKLNTRGILGLGGVLTVTLEKNEVPAYQFTSVALSGDGVPSIDPMDKAQALLDSLH